MSSGCSAVTPTPPSDEGAHSSSRHECWQLTALSPTALLEFPSAQDSCLVQVHSLQPVTAQQRPVRDGAPSLGGQQLRGQPSPGLSRDRLGLLLQLFTVPHPRSSPASLTLTGLSPERTPQAPFCTQTSVPGIVSQEPDPVSTRWGLRS